MKTVVLVPFRADRGHRDRLWHHLRDNYWPNLPYPVVVGHHDDGPFNRSRAVNAAAVNAGDWDVAVIADSDTWVPVRQLMQAVELAGTVHRLSSALTAVAELDPRCTAQILDGTIDFLNIGLDCVRTSELATQSSIIAVPKNLWDRIGGFDEKFCGWGGEDNAFWRAATIMGGHPNRVEGYAYHLWHEQAINTVDRRTDPDYRANLARWNAYRCAKTERALRQAQSNA